MSGLPKFTGQYTHSLDDKGRLIVPARLRGRLGDHFFLTIAPPDPCLALYPEPTWLEFCATLEKAAVKDSRFRRFVRHLFANTDEVSLDAQGRLLLPQALRDFAKIEREIVLVGSLTRVELWSAGNWSKAGAPPDGMADLMTELGLY
jgi:MraZ protein